MSVSIFFDLLLYLTDSCNYPANAFDIHGVRLCFIIIICLYFSSRKRFGSIQTLLGLLQQHYTLRVNIRKHHYDQIYEGVFRLVVHNHPPKT